jgi:hypothetical protein
LWDKGEASPWLNQELLTGTTAKNCTFISSWTPNNSKSTFPHKFYLYSDRSSLIYTNYYTKSLAAAVREIYMHEKNIRLVPATHLFIPSPYHVSLSSYCFYTYVRTVWIVINVHSLQGTCILEDVSISLTSLIWSLHSHWTPSYNRGHIPTEILVVIKAHILIHQNDKNVPSHINSWKYTKTSKYSMGLFCIK